MVINSWTELLNAIWQRKGAFLISFFVVFLVSYGILAWLDFLPELVTNETVKTEESSYNVQNTSRQEVVDLVGNAPQAQVYPLSMSIEALDKVIPILNPSSRTVADLDEALLSGAVRHPDSATLEQAGTVFILGHSSYLPVVRNKNFQAFNGIQNLEWGDEIVITAADGEYTYRVDKVYRAKATDVTVPIAGPNKRLFLATCNSFGSTDDRYIVEAELVDTRLF